MNTKLPSSFAAVLVLASAFASTTLKAFGAELEAPRIVMENRGGSGEPATSPAYFKIRFEPADGSQIDIASFQVLYQFGVFRKDITARILPYVILTASGLTGVVPANLPAGTHTLIIRIRDNQRRTAEQEVNFHVGSH